MPAADDMSDKGARHKKDSDLQKQRVGRFQECLRGLEWTILHKREGQITDGKDI